MVKASKAQYRVLPSVRARRRSDNETMRSLSGYSYTGMAICKRSTCLGVITAWLAVGAMFSAAANPLKVYRKVMPSVMLLEVENFAGEKFTGSAVLAVQNDVAVTAWHVVRDAKVVWATFSDGTRTMVVGCLDKDGERDLALLKLDKPMPGRRAVLNDELQEVASRAYVIGAPKGYGFSISDGLISQIRQVDGFAQYQVSCPISPGNSGGPLLNERGQVIGIVSWTKSDAQNVSFVIPTKEIVRLNAKGRVMSWAQLDLSARPPLAKHWVHPDSSVSTERGEQGFDNFTKRLEKAVGKRVTVVVREGGKESKFSFTVPPVNSK